MSLQRDPMPITYVNVTGEESASSRLEDYIPSYNIFPTMAPSAVLNRPIDKPGSSFFDPTADGWGPEQQPVPPPEPQNMAVVSILIALIVILCIILMFVTIPPLIHMIRRKMPVPQARIDRRYATIDGWLITKRVQPHDSVCECIQHRYGQKKPQMITLPKGSAVIDSESASPKDEHGATQDDVKPTRITLTAAILIEKLAPASDENEESVKLKTSDEYSRCEEDKATPNDLENPSEDDRSSAQDSCEKPECAICLEAFKIHDKVSWSTNPSCGHVFHHSCIREWLLRRVGCPCCRKVLLPVDRSLVQALQPQQQHPVGPEDTAQSTTIAMGSTESSPSQQYSQPSRSATSSFTARNHVSGQMLKSYARERAKRTTTTYYCIHEGLVTLHGFGLLDANREKTREKAEGQPDATTPDENGVLPSKPEHAIVPPSRHRAGGVAQWLDSMVQFAIPSFFLTSLRRSRSMHRSETNGTTSEESSREGDINRTFLQDDKESSSNGSQRNTDDVSSIELIFERASAFTSSDAVLSLHHLEDPSLGGTEGEAAPTGTAEELVAELSAILSLVEI